MGSRYVGQECTVGLTEGGVPVKALTAIKSSDITLKGDAVKSDYLGQPGPDFDEVSDGVEGKLEFEPDDPGFFDFLTRLAERKQGIRTFAVNINIRFVNRNGVSRFAVVPDAQFADIPLSLPERKQKLRGTLSYTAKTVRFPRNV